MRGIARIRLQGALANALIIDEPKVECGDLKAGVAVHFEGDGGAGKDGWCNAAWVMCWEDLELAYQTLKSARSGSPDR